MDTLFDRLLQPGPRKRVVRESVSLLEHHLRGMSGLRGLLARTVFDALRRFRPAFIDRALDRLLPDFVSALEDAYQPGISGTGSVAEDFSAFMLRSPEAVIEALLQVTDRRVADFGHPLISRAYARLRRMAEHEISEVLPDLAAHLPEWLHDDEAAMDA
jgi:hypothetical protein